MRRREDEKEALAKELRGEFSSEEETFLQSQIVSKLERIKVRGGYGRGNG